MLLHEGRVPRLCIGKGTWHLVVLVRPAIFSGTWMALFGHRRCEA